MERDFQDSICHAVVGTPASQKGREAVKKTRKTQASTSVPVSTGEEQIETLQCTGAFGASLIDCSCSGCMVVKLLLARTNPQIRSVMPRRGTRNIAWYEAQWKQIRELVEEETLRRNASTQEEEEEESSSSESDEDVQPEPAPVPVTIEEMTPCPAQGVRLTNLYYSLRGITGERSRDGRSSFDDKYKKSNPTDIIEDITSVAIDPNKILEGMITSAFDCHLPSHGGTDDEHTRREGEWLETFSGTHRGTGTQGKTFIRTSHQPRTES